MFHQPSNKQKTDFLNSIYIASPCDVPWDEMDGNDQTRFCGSCKKNVYNISEMSTDNAVKFLLENNRERPCLKMYKRADGTLITDNCPVGLRKARERFRKIAVKVLFAIGLTVLAQKVQAQGLLGVPVDARYGQSNEVGGGLGDCGYGTARDLVQLVAMLSVPTTAFFGMFSVRKAKENAILWHLRGASSRIVRKLVRRKALQMLGLAFMVPLLIYGIGMTILNCF